MYAHHLAVAVAISGAADAQCTTTVKNAGECRRFLIRL
jgi:hypothetical protein